MNAGARAIRPAILAALLAVPLAAEPHFVLLSVDTLRADAVGAYGAETATTPTIELKKVSTRPNSTEMRKP